VWKRKPALTTGLAIFGVWSALGLLSCAQNALFLGQSGQHMTWRAVNARMLDWYTCAAFTPFFFWMAKRFPVDWRRWHLNLLLQLLASSVAVVIKYALLVAFWRWTRTQVSVSFTRVLASNFIIESMIFWSVIAIIHGILFYRSSAELRTQLSEAQLEVLKAQLRPHFLFNTLNSISTLVHSDPAAADRMVVQLADLLRASLETTGAHEIPLTEELALLERYVEIMRVRHQDRLSVSIRVAARVRSALVPHFILQPLVENAIEHGIGRRGGPGHVVIVAKDAGDRLELRIGDDGGDTRESAASEFVHDEGVGLGNTRRRLEQLYGEAQSFDIRYAEGGGTLVTITLPLRGASVQPIDSPARPLSQLAPSGDD
jgi:signal transduction histidine kinase